MKHGVVIAKRDIVGADDLPFILLRQNLAGVEHLGDEHRSFACRRGR